MPPNIREDESAAAFFNRADVLTIKQLLADLEPLSGQTATKEDFIDLAETDAVPAGDDGRRVRGLATWTFFSSEPATAPRPWTLAAVWLVPRPRWLVVFLSVLMSCWFSPRVIAWKSWPSRATLVPPSASCAVR